MTRRLAQIARLLAIPTLLALGVVTAPTVSAGNPCFHDFSMPAATVATSDQVKLMPCAFEPTVTQVAVGSEVTFLNGPDFAHLITGANQAWGSPDVELRPGATIAYTFDRTGIYPYACAVHPGMSGAVIVGDVAEALSAGSVTDASTSSGSTSANTSEAISPTSEAFDGGDFPLVALGIGAGVVAGAAAVWLAIRRRSPGSSRFVARAE
jgi:plastocyanin